MTQAVSRILEEADRLSADERAELFDLMVERYHDEAVVDFDPAYMQEIYRRTEEVEYGKSVLVSAEEMRARVREVLDELRISP